jgi:hypothetical protein
VADSAHLFDLSSVEETQTYSGHSGPSPRGWSKGCRPRRRRGHQPSIRMPSTSFQRNQSVTPGPLAVSRQGDQLASQLDEKSDRPIWSFPEWLTDSAHLCHPRLRVNRVLRVMLRTRWSAEAWSEVRVKFKRGARGWFIHENASGVKAVLSRSPRQQRPSIIHSRTFTHDVVYDRQRMKSPTVDVPIN